MMVNQIPMTRRALVNWAIALLIIAIFGCYFQKSCLSSSWQEILKVIIIAFAIALIIEVYLVNFKDKREFIFSSKADGDIKKQADEFKKQMEKHSLSFQFGGRYPSQLQDGEQMWRRQGKILFFIENKGGRLSVYKVESKGLI